VDEDIVHEIMQRYIMQRYNATLLVKFSKNFDIESFTTFKNCFSYKIGNDAVFKLFSDGNCRILLKNYSMDNADFYIYSFCHYLKTRMNDDDIYVVDQKICHINCVLNVAGGLDVDNIVNKLLENGFRDKKRNNCCGCFTTLSYLYNGIKGEVTVGKPAISIRGKFPYFNLFTKFKNHVEEILKI